MPAYKDVVDAGAATGVPNIDRIIASAICDGVVTVRGVATPPRLGLDESGPNNTLITLSNAGALGLAIAAGIPIAARKLGCPDPWPDPMLTATFTDRTNAVQCPKPSNVNSVT
jgi:hypothetical protein